MSNVFPVIIDTATPLPLEVKREAPDEREPGKVIVGFYVRGRRISRTALLDEETFEYIRAIENQPRHMQFQIFEEEPGLVARLFVWVPTAELDSEGEEWKAEDPHAGDQYLIPIGNVIRAREAMKDPANVVEEAGEMMMTIIADGTVEPIDHLLQAGRIYAVPNGSFKAEGLKASVPDLCLPCARGPFHGLYIEMKRIGKYGTADQRAFARDLRAQGYAVFECMGKDEAYEFIMKYLALELFDSLRWDAGGRNSLDELRKLREYYHSLWAPRPITKLLPEDSAA